MFMSKIPFIFITTLAISAIILTNSPLILKQVIQPLIILGTHIAIKYHISLIHKELN